MRKSKSIRDKLHEMILVMFLLFACVTGVISVYEINKMSVEDSCLMLNQICEREMLRFDERFSAVEQAVTMLASYTYREMEWHDEDYIYTKECEEKIRDIAISVAGETESISSVYFRYNPEVVGSGTEGFWWAYDPQRGEFVKDSPTDILQYSRYDTKRVGWYYAPKESGTAMWMAPYYNQHHQFMVVSYIVPVYRDDGEFVGVIGMDIDFERMMDILAEARIYDSSRVALVDVAERYVYSSDGKGTWTERLDNTLYNHITTINKENELLEYQNSRREKEVLCYRRLKNGMRLYVGVSKKEIHERRNTLMYQYIGIAAGALLITYWMISRLTDRITSPIMKLADVTKRYAKGEWDEQYVVRTGDEIEVLSFAIAEMAEKTQSYIERIKLDARRDALTGLGNSTYYKECIAQITDEEKGKEYGVIVFDLNYLKKTNDTYGHEAGDLLLKTAADFIADCFPDCPAFRIGGDEFVVLLTEDELPNYDKMLCRFDREMDRKVPGLEEISLSIARGFAQFGMDGSSYEEVFRKADDRMYICKCEMKVTR